MLERVSKFSCNIPLKVINTRKRKFMMYVELNSFYKRRVNKTLHSYKKQIVKIIRVYQEDEKKYYLSSLENKNIDWRETEVRREISMKEMKEQYPEYLL